MPLLFLNKLMCYEINVYCQSLILLDCTCTIAQMDCAIEISQHFTIVPKNTVKCYEILLND